MKRQFGTCAWILLVSLPPKLQGFTSYESPDRGVVRMGLRGRIFLRAPTLTLEVLQPDMNKDHFYLAKNIERPYF